MREKVGQQIKRIFNELYWYIDNRLGKFKSPH